jgi:hypothetical protein
MVTAAGPERRPIHDTKSTHKEYKRRLQRKRAEGVSLDGSEMNLLDVLNIE